MGLFTISKNKVSTLSTRPNYLHYKDIGTCLSFPTGNSTGNISVILVTYKEQKQCQFIKSQISCGKVSTNRMKGVGHEEDEGRQGSSTWGQTEKLLTTRGCIQCAAVPTTGLCKKRRCAHAETLVLRGQCQNPNTPISTQPWVMMLIYIKQASTVFQREYKGELPIYSLV